MTTFKHTTMMLDYTLLILNLLASLLMFVESSGTTLIASAPVHPVEEGGIFSLRCEVAKMKPNQEMTIFRTSQEGNKRLSVNDEVLDDAGDRVYLAVRQMTDGKTVYLLSIMKVERDDEGLYICKLFDKDAFEWVSEDDFALQVMYVPSDSEPSCAHVESTNVMEGTAIDLNCSSELAFPAVTLQWSRTGGGVVPSTTSSTQINRVYSSFTFIPTMADQNVVFLCGIKSIAFPNFEQTCHVGPFTVYRNPDLVRNDDDDDTIITDNPLVGGPNKFSPNGDRVNRPGIHTDDGSSHSDLSADCMKTCSANRYPVLYWIIATTVACFLATIFFILGLVLVLKYRRLSIQPKPTYYLAQHPMDDIYTELECKRGDATVYMSLGKHGKPTPVLPTSSVPVFKGPTLEPISDSNEKHYDYEARIAEHC